MLKSHVLTKKKKKIHRHKGPAQNQTANADIYLYSISDDVPSPLHSPHDGDGQQGPWRHLITH